MRRPSIEGSDRTSPHSRQRTIRALTLSFNRRAENGAEFNSAAVKLAGYNSSAFPNLPQMAHGVAHELRRRAEIGVFDEGHARILHLRRLPGEPLGQRQVCREPAIA